MNIIILCTYPAEKLLHGGQFRVHNIKKMYVSAGHHVEICGVLGSGSYSSSDGFEPYPGYSELSQVISKPMFMEDLAIGKLFSSSNKYYDKLARQVKIKPDIIHVEQPWLFKFSQKLALSYKEKPKIIYGSQNIEYQLKKSILENYVDMTSASELSSLVKDEEVYAVEQADGVVCVSDNDMEWVLQHTEKPVILAQNGVSSWTSDSHGLEEANRITCHRKTALFCASAHPPNMKGFFDMFGGGFGCLSNAERLVVAGSAGDHIVESSEIDESANLKKYVVSAGIVGEKCLSGLLDIAHCIVLPITQGGGTNLKTAEALWAGHHIVATSKAMRGFEKFIGSPGVTVIDSSTDFKLALRKAMQSPPLKLSAADIKLRESVLWESCLNHLPSFVQTIVNSDKR